MSYKALHRTGGLRALASGEAFVADTVGEVQSHVAYRISGRVRPLKCGTSTY